jgi:hypothetical protein
MRQTSIKPAKSATIEARGFEAAIPQSQVARGRKKIDLAPA